MTICKACKRKDYWLREGKDCGLKLPLELTSYETGKIRYQPSEYFIKYGNTLCKETK